MDNLTVKEFKNVTKYFGFPNYLSRQDVTKEVRENLGLVNLVKYYERYYFVPSKTRIYVLPWTFEKIDSKTNVEYYNCHRKSSRNRTTIRYYVSDDRWSRVMLIGKDKKFLESSITCKFTLDELRNCRNYLIREEHFLFYLKLLIFNHTEFTDWPDDLQNYLKTNFCDI